MPNECNFQMMNLIIKPSAINLEEEITENFIKLNFIVTAY
jgi:hypothetical protein